MADEGFEELSDEERGRYLNRAVAQLQPDNRKRLHAFCREWEMTVEEFCAAHFDLDDMIRDEMWHERYGTGEEDRMDLTGMIACHTMAGS